MSNGAADNHEEQQVIAKGWLKSHLGNWWGQRKNPPS
jgi:hypothetical protein